MKAADRAIAQRQLDKKLIPLQNIDETMRPQHGWVKAIREALGLTTRQFAKRLGLSQPRAVEIEKAEVSGSITLNSLRRAAEALDCRLVYALVPNVPLEAAVKNRARAKARQRLAKIRHTMALEDQRVDAADEEEQLKRLIEKLLAQSGSTLWEDE